MKIDITEKKINLKKLDEAIKECQSSWNSKKIYLFMSKETAAEMTFSHDFKTFQNNSYSVFTYLEKNVYIDDSLNFGEIVIK